MILSLVTSFLAFAATPRQVSALNEHVGLYITPPETIQNPPGVDSFFDVYLDISDVSDLFGFDIKVTWDNTLITRDDPVSNATTISLLNALWPTGWFAAKEEYSGGGGGGGYYRLAAVSISTAYSGTHSLFNMHFKIVKECNFLLQTPLHIEAGYKLSDNFWQTIPVETVTDGVFKMNPTEPDLEFEMFEPNGHPWEYCKTFQIKVYVTHICANLEDYNLVILYNTELLKLTGVDWTGGVLGGSSDGASYTELPPGTINVVDTGGIVWSGDQGLLFTLAFHIEFDDREEHIWRTGHSNDLTTYVSFSDAELSFLEGNIAMSGIAMPSPQDIVVHLIRGDVDCDGDVHVIDLRCVGIFYDKIQGDPEWVTCEKYDLNMDNIIDLFDLVVVATNVGYGTGP
jgi:hypothetical protein